MSVTVNGEQFLPQCSGVCAINQFRGYIINAVATIGENIRILLKNTDITSTIQSNYMGSDEILTIRETERTKRVDAKIWMGDDLLGTWPLLPDSYVSIQSIPNTNQEVALTINHNIVITIKFFYSDNMDTSVELTANEIIKITTFTYIVKAIPGMVGIPNMFDPSNFTDIDSVYI